MVLDEQDRQLVVGTQPADQLGEAPDLLVVEAAGRLVEQKELRLCRKRARELDALQRPERQSGRGRRRKLREPERVEDLE